MACINPIRISKYFFLFPFGCLVFGVMVLLILMVTPLHIYRWFVSKIVPNFPFSKWGKIVCFHGSGLATDFTPSNIPTSSRHSVVVSLIFEGMVNEDTFKSAILQQWIFARSRNGSLRYPELQQHLEPCMGYMFWKPDKDFAVDDHINSVDLSTKLDEEALEEFVQSYTEELMNKPFVLDKSPWEFHILHNYRNFPISREPITLVLLRLHHVLIDGPAFYSALISGLGYRTSQMNLATFTRRRKQRILDRVLKMLSFFTRVGSEMLHILSRIERNKVWFATKGKQSGIQCYARTNFISVDIIKEIKRKYQTSFSAVIFACTSSAISKLMHKSGNPKWEDTKFLATAIPIPMRHASHKLDIKSTGTVMMLPVSEYLARSVRLQTCDQLLKNIKMSTIPLFWHFWEKIVLVQFIPLARFLWKNRFCSTFITGFPGSTGEILWNKKEKILTYDYAVGTFSGSASVAIAISTYLNRLRVTITAEDSVLSRDQVNTLVQFIEAEIYELYSLV